MDIVKFYPSIKKELLNKALHWASTVTEEPITEQTRDIISHARKSLLISKSTQGSGSMPWIKKNGLFDVTIRAPDRAEVGELVGLFLLNQVNNNFPDLDYGLYRDDGLATHRHIEEIRQGLHKLFKSHRP